MNVLKSRRGPAPAVRQRDPELQDAYRSARDDRLVVNDAAPCRHPLQVSRLQWRGAAIFDRVFQEQRRRLHARVRVRGANARAVATVDSIVRQQEKRIAELALVGPY